MSATSLKDTVFYYFEEIWNNKNVDELEKFYPSTDRLEQEGLARQELPTLEAATDYVRRVQAAFPDLKVTVEDIIAEGDMVAIRTIWHGTYEGEPLEDVPPTGESVTLQGNVIWRIVDGKILEMKGTQGEGELARLGLLDYLVSPGAVFFKLPPWKCGR
jgi:predicted ester cyclase